MLAEKRASSVRDDNLVNTPLWQQQKAQFPKMSDGDLRGLHVAVGLQTA
jgi:hypothetical protein